MSDTSITSLRLIELAEIASATDDAVSALDDNVSETDEDDIYVKAYAAEDDFNDAIRTLLSNGDDHIIDNCVEHTDDAEILSYIQHTVQLCASMDDIWTTDEDYLQGELILLPFFQISNGNTKHKSTMSQPDVDVLVKSFRNSGLYPKNCSVLLHGHIFTPVELLNYDYSDIYQFKETLLRTITQSGTGELPSMDSSDKFFENDDIFCLRYLIGCVIAAPEELEEYYTAQTLDKFVEIASIILKRSLRAKEVRLLPPGNYYEQLEASLNVYSTFDIIQKLEQTFIKHKIHPHGVVLQISLEHNSISVISKLTNDIIETIEYIWTEAQSFVEFIEHLDHQLLGLDIYSDDIYVRNEDDEDFILVREFLEFCCSSDEDE